jgi:hypothetical protein
MLCDVVIASTAASFGLVGGRALLAAALAVVQPLLGALHEGVAAQ